MLRCAGAVTDFVKMPSDLKLQVNLEDDDKLVTQRTPVVWAPQWGLSVDLGGDRDYSRIFRLPNMGGWIQRWVYARGPESELVPEGALENSTAESTSIFQCLPHFGQALPVLSTHWFLCPFKSHNGFTVGLTFLDVQLARLTDTAIAPSTCGRFAMDESTGEVFMTSYRADDGLMVVAWTQTISSCERVRELLLFEAAPHDGVPPGRVLLRNSFYERRNCRMCGDVVGARLNPPCRSPARPRAQRARAAPDALLPLQTMYRRFRGYFFGTCVKTKYSYAPGDAGGGATGMSSVAVPIVLDIRHGIESVARRLRLSLRRTALTFGTGPRVATRMLLTRGHAHITASDSPSGSSGAASEASARERSPRRGSGAASGGSGGARASPAPDDAKRRRNADAVHDRDSILHMRKVRNRESAARTNEARKRRIESNKRELEDLKTNKVPALRLREQQLVFENKRLKEMVAAARPVPEESIMSPGIIGELPLPGVFEFPEDLFY